MTGSDILPFLVGVVLPVAILWNIARVERRKKEHNALPEFRIDYNPVTNSYRVMMRKHWLPSATHDTVYIPYVDRDYPTLQAAMDAIDGIVAARAKSDGWAKEHRTSFHYPTGEPYDTRSNR